MLKIQPVKVFRGIVRQNKDKISAIRSHLQRSANLMIINQKPNEILQV